MKQPIPFGKYFLLERINVGGMAEVFKAKATGVEGFERLVAVKRILPSIAEDEEFITMFVDEAKIAVQLTHANIAQIFDLGRVEGSFFIALEYVHGKDLRAMFNRMRQRGELLPIPLSCYSVMKLCEGLDYAHNKRDSSGDLLNLVHRDVSPQNIIVSYEGEVKIIDFGIAKAAGKVGRTQAGILKGKFGYMSPEQVQGLEIDRRSDVFGVGICLYELLTGERLFIAESDFATLEKVRSVDVMPPSTYNRRIPEELEQIVMRSLARDRDQRYQSALQLHDELQSFMHTSGNLFSRKDLSVFMHRVFGEELEKETARDQEYAQLGTPLYNAEPSGLEVFDELEPVSTVSALADGGGPQPVPFTPNATLSRNAAARKSTLLGIPPLGVRPAPPSVPRLVPRLQSMPPSAASSNGSGGFPPVPDYAPQPARSPTLPPATLPNGYLAPPSARNNGGARAPSNPGMEWDDEELSTQIYDKPDERALAFVFGSKPATSPGSLPSAPPATLLAEAAQAPAVHPARADTLPVRALEPMLDPSDLEPSWPQRPRGRPMLVAILVVVGIIGCIVTGLLLFGRPDPSNVQFASVPTQASVTVDGRPVSGSSSPFVLAQLTPNVAHTIVVTSPGHRPWTSRVELSAGQTMQLPTVHLEKIESGFAIDSQPPGARVLVDGAARGVTPLRLTDLTSGEHRVRLEFDGHTPWDSVLHVGEGTVLPLPPVILQPMAAVPTVSPPRGRASSSHASGEPTSSTSRRRGSASGEPEASSEPHEAASTASTHKSEPVAAAEPEPEAEEPEASESAASGPGTLRINTRPWSNVFIDGKLIGPTPQLNLQLPSGEHTLLLVNDEFGIRKSMTVVIKPGEVTKQILNLAD